MDPLLSVFCRMSGCLSVIVNDYGDRGQTYTSLFFTGSLFPRDNLVIDRKIAAILRKKFWLQCFPSFRNSAFGSFTKRDDH